MQVTIEAEPPVDADDFTATLQSALDNLDEEATAGVTVVALPDEDVDEALEDLEDAMAAGERTLGHDEVRPSATMLAHRTRDAYRTLVEAHPRYQLQEGGDDGA